MSSKVIHFILNQDRYCYYNYHELCNVGDRIVCFCDPSGRVPEKSEIGSNVEIVQFDRDFDIEGVSREVRARLRGEQAVRFICNEDKYFLLAALLREKFGAPGMPLRWAKFYRDKTEMKRQVAELGIAVPRWVKFEDAPSYDIASKKLESTQFVVKPINGYGSRDTFIVRSSEEFKAMPEIEPGKYEIESFLDGELYHVDSVYFEGKIVYSKAFSYSYPNIEYKNGKNIGSLELYDDSPLKKKFFEIDAKIAEFTGETCVSHMELFVVDGEVIFLEVQARPPGGLLVPLHRLTHGVNFSAEAAKIQMDPGYRPDPCDQYLCFGTFFLIGRPTVEVVTQINIPNLECQISMSHVNLEVGDRSITGSSVRENGAVYLLQSDDRSKVERDFYYLKTFRMFE